MRKQLMTSMIFFAIIIASVNAKTVLEVNNPACPQGSLTSGICTFMNFQIPAIVNVNLRPLGFSNWQAVINSQQLLIREQQAEEVQLVSNFKSQTSLGTSGAGGGGMNISALASSEAQLAGSEELNQVILQNETLNYEKSIQSTTSTSSILSSTTTLQVSTTPIATSIQPTTTQQSCSSVVCINTNANASQTNINNQLNATINLDNQDQALITANITAVEITSTPTSISSPSTPILLPPQELPPTATNVNQATQIIVQEQIPQITQIQVNNPNIGVISATGGTSSMNPSGIAAQQTAVASATSAPAIETQASAVAAPTVASAPSMADSGGAAASVGASAGVSV